MAVVEHMCIMRQLGLLKNPHVKTPPAMYTWKSKLSESTNGPAGNLQGETMNQDSNCCLLALRSIWKVRLGDATHLGEILATWGDRGPLRFGGGGARASSQAALQKCEAASMLPIRFRTHLPLAEHQ